jgi:magnesium-transporting ATPase (P-type)
MTLYRGYAVVKRSSSSLKSPLPEPKNGCFLADIFFGWLALFGIIGFLALMVSVFLLPLKFFFQTIKNNPEKSWAGKAD